jgi:hypothetical protein
MKNLFLNIYLFITNLFWVAAIMLEVMGNGFRIKNKEFQSVLIISIIIIFNTIFIFQFTNRKNNVYRFGSIIFLIATLCIFCYLFLKLFVIGINSQNIIFLLLLIYPIFSTCHILLNTFKPLPNA